MDGGICEFPFTLNNVSNYFCAIDETIEENDALQCETSSGLSDCTLGTILSDIISLKIIV